MNRNALKKILMGAAVVAIVGFGVNAMAGWGRGYDCQGWGPEGPGKYGRGGDGPGYGYTRQNLSEEQIKKIDEARQGFFAETADLRQGLYAKGLELRAELAKEKPDAKMASEIQREISELRAQLGQKRIGHVIKMREIDPDAGRRYMGRGMMGGGPKGYGSRGGYCRR